MQIRLLAFFLFGIATQSSAQTVHTTQISLAQALTDLQIIRKSIDEVHPGTNRFQQQAAYIVAYDSVQNVIERYDSLAPITFFRIVNPFITKVKCGHIKFFPPMKEFPFYYHTENLFPAIVKFDDQGKLLIVQSDYPALNGKFLKAINDSDINDIIKKLRENIFADGNSKSSAPAQIEQYFSAWYADFIQDSADFKLTVSDSDENETNMQVSGIPLSKWKSLHTKTTWLAQKNELTFKNDSIAVLRVANFQVSQKEFSAFLMKSFEEIKRQKPARLIIDVRGNEGGEDALGKDLYAYIARENFQYYDRIEVKIRSKKDVTYREHTHFPKFSGLAKLFIKKKNGTLRWTRHQNLGIHKPRKNAFQGEVTFLGDGLSFSVTSEFLSVAKSQSRGLFIGTESGGTYEGNNSGGFLIFKLPASQFDLGIPLGGYYSAVKPVAPTGRGVIPDFNILPCAEDLLAGRDTVLNFALRANASDLHTAKAH